MENQKEFSDFEKALRENNMGFGGLTQFTRMDNENLFYKSFLTESKYFDDLNTSMDIQIFAAIPDEISLRNLKSESLLTKAMIPVIYSNPLSTGYDGLGDEVAPGLWHTIPNRFKEESKLIHSLDRHINSFINQKVFNNSRSPLLREAYSKAVKEGNFYFEEIQGKSIPYVVLDKDTLNAGAILPGHPLYSLGDLNFVSSEIGKEDIKEFLEREYFDGGLITN